jgi:hypothetical protein
MYNEINLQLEQAQQGVFRLCKIESMVKELQRQQYELEDKSMELKSILNKENLDVEKLEKKSLSNIFYSLLGSLDNRIEKENSEALAAKLKYDQAVQELENVKSEIAKLYSERMQYRDSEQKYTDLYKQKKSLLMQSNEEIAKVLLDLYEQLGVSKNNLKEINEASLAGKRVIACLDNALNNLNSAEGWGTWDLLGGGMISDLAKHSHIDDAKNDVANAQNLLRNFKSELADIKINSDIHIETDGFAKFADFFFDGLIADWVMQSKIQNSYESVKQVKTKVSSVLSKLSILEKQEKSNGIAIENKINDIIIKQQ